MAKLPLQVRKRLPGGGWRVLHDHSLTQMLRAMNRWMGPSQTRGYLAVGWHFATISYAVSERGVAGEPIAIIPVSTGHA